jgi:hypothetical protein
MNSVVRFRLGKALVVLVLALAILGLSHRPAEALASCSSYIGCELCQCREEACVNGETLPACAGDPACCHSKETLCYSNCIWY